MSRNLPGPLSIDLFCRVVDNFGDIGVCWRLARQLAVLSCDVRLYVDDFKTFARIEPELNAEADFQVLKSVTVLRWEDGVLKQHYAAPHLPMADAVIEAFACDLPDQVIQAMRDSAPHPVWLDLEYLSAEGWVDENHAVISLHPLTGMKKTLFFPGFTAKTGGLSREIGLIAEKEAFQSSQNAQNQWRKAHFIPEIAENTVDISLFCYNNAPLDVLVRGMESWPVSLRLLVPEGVAEPQRAALKNRLPANITTHIVPFLTQHDYDKLLWTADVNFVRGEDSFIRAIWAGRPMVWQIYVQEEQAHLVKLRAFLDRYSRDLDVKDAEILAKFTIMWNVGTLEEGAVSVAPDFFEILPRLHRHAQDWSQSLATQPDLASQIIRFIQAQKEHTE